MKDLIGSTLGIYRLTSLLGQGGFADTYLGEHVYLETKVVIKIVQTQLTQPDLTRLVNEWRTIARLSHPSIIHFLDFGTDDSRNIAYLVTEYAPNGTLRQRHPYGNTVPLPTLLSYVKQIAAALQYIHDHNIIHRDVKPDNMLVGKHQEILLSGLEMSIIETSARVQPSNAISGTPIYMAPELILGQPTFASDQYALGIVVYEWLCGMHPFNGSRDEIIAQHTSTPPPSLRAKVPSILPEIEEVVMIALAKEPQERFKNVNAFARALELAGGITAWQSRAPGSRFPSAPPHLSPGSIAGSGRNSYGATPFEPPKADLWSAPGYQGSPSPDPQTPSLPNSASDPQTPSLLPSLPNSSYPPQQTSSLPNSSYPPQTLSFLRETGNKLTRLFSRRKKPQETELTLFVIARATLEADDCALIDKIYTIQAGISQHKITDFYSEPFNIVTQNPLEPLLFSILFHPSENIVLLEKQYQHLTYDTGNTEPQFISCQFRVLKPGEHSIAINFYRKQQWLKTINFVFTSVEQSLHSSPIAGR